MSIILKKISKLLTNNDGFTLVELLVVIAILGILAGVTSPNITRYVTDARESADIANGAIIANAMLRAVAEGYEIDSTDGTGEGDIEGITGDILRDKKGNDYELVPDFIQSIPKIQDGNGNFGYTYQEGVLTIYKETSRGAKRLYPNPVFD